MSAERIVITGGSGSLGSSIVEQAEQRGLEYIAPTHIQLDIANEAEIEKLFEQYQPTTIINTAGMVDQAPCDNDPRAAYKANTYAVQVLAEQASRHHAYMAHVSAAMVFGGRTDHHPFSEADKPLPPPENTYGHTKLLGELAMLEQVQDGLLIRIGWLFGSTPGMDRKFVGNVLSQIAAHANTLKAMNDVYSSPVYAPDVANFVLDAIGSRLNGIRHMVAGDGPFTKYDMAVAIAKLWAPGTEVIAVPASEFSVKPTYTVLGSEYDDSGLTDWHEAMERYHEANPDPASFALAA